MQTPARDPRGSDLAGGARAGVRNGSGRGASHGTGCLPLRERALHLTLVFPRSGWSGRCSLPVAGRPPNATGVSLRLRLGLQLVSHDPDFARGLDAETDVAALAAHHVDADVPADVEDLAPAGSCAIAWARRSNSSPRTAHSLAID
jgi:hypothetical protein